MIKIAFVINYITNNGPSRVVLDIIHNLDYSRYDISIITLFSGNDVIIVGKLKNEGLKVYDCKSLSRIKCMCGMNSEFVKIVQKEQFDIIHTHGLIPDLLVSRIKGKAKTVSTLHNIMFEDYINQYGALKSWMFTKIHLYALQHIDRKVCCSASVYSIMRKYLDSIVFIRNGIEKPVAKTIVTRKQLAIPDEARVYIFVGGLIPRKNVKFLLSEFTRNRLNNEYLLIIGDGPEKDACSLLADDHVIMCGFQTDPVSYFDISDIYVSASKSEGFSIAVLEALFCGLGLFLSDIPSHREVIEMQNNDILGVLFQENSFANSMELVRKIKLNRSAIQNFSLAKLSASCMANKYDKEYSILYNSIER